MVSTPLASRPALRSGSPVTASIAAGKTTSPHAGVLAGHAQAAAASTAADSAASAAIVIRSNLRLNGTRPHRPGMAAIAPNTSAAAAAAAGAASQATAASGISATQAAIRSRQVSTYS